MQKTLEIRVGDGVVHYELASFGDRFVARIIDVLIISIPSLIIPILPGWLYWALQQSGASQATVGQKAMKIKTVSLDGNEVSFGQATGRFFGNLLNVLTLGIGFILFFTTEKQQCLHDLVSNCAIVKAEPLDDEEDLSLY